MSVISAPVKRNVCMASHFSNERMVNDGNIFNDAIIAQSDRDNLVVHAGLWLRKQELAPMFGQSVVRPHTHRSHDAPPWDLRRHRRFHDEPGMTTHPLVDNNPATHS